MIEQLKENTNDVYESMQETFLAHMEYLENVIGEFKENMYLTDIEEEEYPNLLNELEVVTDILGKLENSATREWFVGMVNSDIAETITKEELDTLEAALKVQDKLDIILDKGVNELSDYLGKDMGSKHKVN